jgi:hypothetical protein
MASRFPAGAQAAALAPAGIGLALFVVVVQLRMDESWANGVLFIVAGLAAAALLVLGLAAAEGDSAARAPVTALLVAGLTVAVLTVVRFGQILGGDDFTASGGTLTLVLAIYTGIAAFCALRSGSSVCVLIAALAATALFLEFVNWVFGADDVDTYRVLLALVFIVLAGAGVTLGGRNGTMLVAAAGLTAIAGFYTTGLAFLFGGDEGGLGWGWELIALLEGLALAAYAATRLEPGPGYLAFVILVIFAGTTAIVAPAIISFEEDVPEEPSASLVGWPLALAIATVVAAVLGWQRQTAAKS